MYWIGVDHHKRTSYVTTLAEDGSVVCQRNLSARADTLNAFFADHPRPYVVGVEATYAWEYVADIVESLGAEVRVAHPLLLKAFAKRHKKNDQIDSALIATLLRQGHLPTIAHPTRQARQQRDLYRQRMDLVRRRSAAASRAKAFADRLGFHATMRLSTRQGIGHLAALPVGPARQGVLASHVRCLTFLREEIQRLEQAIGAAALASPDARLLRTIHGIGPYLALLIASEIFDVRRFATARRLVGYAGVAPGAVSSGGQTPRGRLMPNVNRYLRWAFTEAVGHYTAKCVWAQRRYDRLRRAKGWKTARVAIARHIATVAYSVLRERRPYRADPHALADDARKDRDRKDRNRKDGNREAP